MNNTIDTSRVPLSTEQIIALLDIYESEWQHRNNILWSQVFKLFYFSIFIMSLPIISSGLGYNLPQISSLIFPVIGAISAVFSYYMAISYALRLKVTRDSIDKLLRFLPPKYRIKKLPTIKYGKFFMWRQTIVIPTVLFVVEVALATFLCYCIFKGLLQPAIAVQP